jgi:hypothetical protein
VDIGVSSTAATTAKFSSILLVHGPISPGPVSAATSALVRGVQLQSGAVVLHYFCGLHPETEGSAENGEGEPTKLIGPCGILRGLIFQLLSSTYFPDHPTATMTAMADRYYINISGERRFYSEEFVRNFKSGSSIQALCHVFARLMEHLPPQTTVYCLIDGISSYDWDELWAGELKYMMQRLKSLIARLNGPYLKLFMTSPGRSRFDSD